MKKTKPGFLKTLFFTLNPKLKDVLFYVLTITAIVTTKKFQGWGRKKTGEFALKCYKKFGGEITRYEDGFIRSLGLSANGHPSFSLVEDNIGLYLDATQPSKLEDILNHYNFDSDDALMAKSKQAIALIKKLQISKYNHAPIINASFFESDKSPEKVLVIAQTAGDASLQYGLCTQTDADKMLGEALNQNPKASIYLKVHPDVLNGKKASNIEASNIPKSVRIIDEDINPISLLKHFDTVYTCTSGMGMEALILGKKVTCYGLPFYAGWGLTEDKQSCNRRKRQLTIEELFAGAYILYTQYYNPYTQQPSDIIDTIQAIAARK